MTSGRLFNRPDTMFGICEGIGEDFGFHPNWLRVALGTGLLWNPPAMVAIYAALGLLVFASRWLVPVPVAPTTPARAEAEAIEAPAAAAEPERLAA